VNDLETKRLRLRKPRPDDLESLARWNADAVVMEHMGRPPMTQEETADQLDRFLGHWDDHGFGLWIAEERATGRPIGRIGLQFHGEWPGEPEAGWLLDPAYWGLGLATEGGAAAIRRGFQELEAPRIVSICTPENLASRRVMAKLGLSRLVEKRHSELGILLWIHAVERSSTATDR
jgi:RimJ/RimL family protein N-acetyltransferase